MVVLTRRLMIAAALVATPLAGSATDFATAVDPAAVPEAKRTPLGLYMTAADAAGAASAAFFVDVRDPMELEVVGAPLGIDANIPASLLTREYDKKRRGHVWAPNPGFETEVAAAMAVRGLGKDDPVLVSCRSGGRSAMAARRLVAAGFTEVWNVVDGFEGDANPASGARDMNGWRNAGLPWTYDIAPEVV
jgi:rhodanese-related sulfurtransferase